jgi:FtsP/CotA-like multicopper oxidase with cupredoxin domain
MRKYTLILAMFFVNISAFGQIDTTVTLVSKIDAFPQFQLADGNQIYMMGYTQLIGAPIDIPAPTLNFTEGDSVQLNMWNLSQGPPHTIHLHGLDVDQANDGVPALSFAVPHDDTGSYYFQAPHAGTYIYHCHETSVLHVQAGMYGMVIVRPQTADTLTWDGGYSFHSENAWMMSEIDTNWHVDSIINHDYDPMEMTHAIVDYMPQHFLVNGRSEQQLNGSSSELSMSVGEKVYLRLANIGNFGNTLVFPPQLNAQVVASDGRPLPSAYFSDTLILLPGERYGVLLESSTLFTDSIQVDYFSLNTGEVWNTQYVDVDVDGFLNIETLDETSLKVYPNPTNGSLVVNLPSSGGTTKTVTVVNLIGELIMTQKFTGEEHTIDLINLQTGTYLLEILHDENKYVQKIIKR